MTSEIGHNYCLHRRHKVLWHTVLTGRITSVIQCWKLRFQCQTVPKKFDNS